MLNNPLSCEKADPDGFVKLRQRLTEIGYSPESVISRLQLSDVSALYPLDYRRLPRFVELLDARPSPLSTVIRLLLLGLPGQQDRAKAALGERGLLFCLECGLLSKDDSGIHAILSIVPFRHLLIATDKLFMNVDPDFVEPGLSSDSCVWRIDRTTLIMSKALKKRKYKSVLELGCGSGVLSLLIAKKAEKVIGIDINPRAVNLAKFNAGLNGINNTIFTQGDLYQPMKGKKFDYIFSNPPSAPGLVRAWNREGGATGREMVEDMLRGLEEHLTPGGVFQTTMHFGYRKKNDITVWLQTVLPDKSFSTRVLECSKPASSVDFALNEAYQKAGPRDFELFERTYKVYIEAFNRYGSEKVAFGLLTIERKP
jgi:HemK-related putative methylase